MNTKSVNIYDFADFRKFLSEYQVKRHQEDKKFTKSEFCKQLGLPNTRSYFQDVLNHKPITKNFVERFIKVLALDREESQFFRVMVQYNQSQNEQERDLLFEQLISLNKTPKRFVDPKAYNYYKHWYNSAIFALLDVIDFKDDYKALARKLFPNITPKQARESIQLMRRLKLIKPNAGGFWKATDTSITTGAYVRNELVKHYQLQSLELGKQIVMCNSAKPHNISTMTISISEKAYKLIENKLQQFKSEIRSIVHKEVNPADRVYQLNIQYFPQSQWEEKK